MKIKVRIVSKTQTIPIRQATELEGSVYRYSQALYEWAAVVLKIINGKPIILVGGQRDCN